MEPVVLTLLLVALPERLEMRFEQAPEGCALDVRLPQSVARYLPRLVIGGESGPGTWRLAVFSRPGEVEVVLSDDAEEERLRRVLPGALEACAATADGIGLILERYLSDLGYETGFAPLPEIETATVAREVDTGTVAAPASSSVGVQLDARGTVDASQTGARFGGGIDLALGIGFFRLEVGFFGLAPGASDLLRRGESIGEYRVWSLGGLLRAGACAHLDPFSICGLAGGGVERVSARVDADSLFVRTPGVAWGGMITAGARVDWSLGPILLFFRGETIVRPDRSRFEVDGIGVGYRDSRVAAFLSLGAAVKLF